jgi:predicted nucleotidyltransferase
MTNLRKKDRENICRIAENCFKDPIEIWTYGSRVTDDSHDASDLDLVIRTSDLKPLDWRELMDFQEQIRESNIPIVVQAFDWAKLPDSFHTNILKKYELLYSNLKKVNADG